MRELTPELWSRIEPLLDALLDLPAEQRAAALARDCSDEQLRAAVLEVLELDARDDGQFDRVTRDVGASGAASAGLEGRAIGPYRVQRAIGEGGMGAVFLATRETAEFTQRVALKLLRVGLFSSAQQEMFRREQRIHARLEHPNIARVYDSGITDAGVPYFAMEYIDGVAVTDYCDRARLDVDARLRLFMTICDAVAYAHQNLVVHRDLKPSNILVNADGVPKLLDFGIAKLLRDTGDQAEATRTAWRAFTPAYAAPEQLEPGSITTATDVYALGIVLGELLTGARPSRNADGEMQGSITGSLSAAVATVRSSSVRSLARRLRGDIDAILRRSLQADPQRRYPGAAALRDDIQRHLQGRPIRAQPDAWIYRSGKFLARHRLAAAAGAVIAAILVAATLFSMRQAGVARSEARRAGAEAARANAVKQFLLDLFESSAPGDPHPVETADAMLDKGLAQARAGYKDQPELQVDVLRSVGDIQHRRGHYEAARTPLEEAVSLSSEKFGPGDPRTLDAVVALSRVDEAANAYAAAEQRLEKAIAAYRAANSAESTALAHALQQLGVMKLRQHRLDEAIALEQEALAMYRRLVPEDSDDINTTMIGLGDALDHAGRSAEAAELFRTVVARTRRQYGDAHVLTAQALGYLAAPLRESGRVDEAENALREAVAINRKVYLAPNLHATDTLYELGKTLRAAGKYSESEAVFREELDLERQLFPDGHPNIASTLKNIAAALSANGRPAEAESLLRESLALDLRLRGPDHPYIAQARTSLARALIAQGKPDEAQPLLDAALTADRKRYGESHASIAADLVGAAELAAARNDCAAALDASERAAAMYASSLPAAHPSRLEADLQSADCLLALGRHGEAVARFDRASAAAQSGTPPVVATVARALLGLARAQMAGGDTTRARVTLASAQQQAARLDSAASPVATEIARLAASLQ